MHVKAPMSQLSLGRASMTTGDCIYMNGHLAQGLDDQSGTDRVPKYAAVPLNLGIALDSCGGDFYSFFCHLTFEIHLGPAHL